MTDYHTQWLIETACNLSSKTDACRPVDVEGIAGNLSVEIAEYYFPDHQRTRGFVEDCGKGSLRILLERPLAKGTPLSVRERFTVAHELAHVLLIKRFSWNPTQGKEYFLCERLCNLFAGHLLVPQKVIRSLTIHSPAQAVDSATALRDAYRVSLQVAARRIVDSSIRLTFFRGKPSANWKKQPVVDVLWAECSAGAPVLRAQQHLSVNSSLGSFFLNRVFSSPYFNGSTKLDLGEVYARCTPRMNSFAAICCEAALEK